MRELTEAPRNLSNLAAEERHQLLEAAIKRENEKLHASAPPLQVINSEDMLNHIKNVNIDERYHNSRYQLIVKSGWHYTVVDIDKREGKKSIVILDAANDIRGIRLRYAAIDNGYKVIFAGGLSWDPSSNLQKDSHSCSLFSFDHCVQLSHTEPDFHTHIAEKGDSYGFVFWDNLPPNFMWNAQSTKILDEYQNKMKDDPSLDQVMSNGLSYHEYVALGVCVYPDGTGVPVTRNESVNIHTLKGMRAEENLATLDATLTDDSMNKDQELSEENLATPNDDLTDDSLNRHQEFGEENLATPDDILTDDSLNSHQELSEENLAIPNDDLTDDSLNRHQEFGEENLATPDDILTDDSLNSHQELGEENLATPNDSIIDEFEAKSKIFKDLRNTLITLKVNDHDTQMDEFLDACDQWKKGENTEEQVKSLNHQIANMQTAIRGLDSIENREVKALIQKFDTRNKLWTIGMDRKARRIETSLISIPIMERAQLLQSKHSSVTSLLEAIASHRLSVFTKTTNEKGQVIADNASNTFKEFKEKFNTAIAAREDVALDNDEINQPNSLH